MLRTRKNKKEKEAGSLVITNPRNPRVRFASLRGKWEGLGNRMLPSEQGEVATINNLVTGVGSVLDGESLLTSRSPF